MTSVRKSLPGILFGLLAALPASAASPGELHIAAAANLTQVMPELDSAFERSAGIRAVAGFGATAQLAQQIENGAPFDLFLAADAEHVDRLAKSGFCAPGTRSIYAVGRLIVWTPGMPRLGSLQDLAGPAIRVIAVARPELAPYGEAAVESLRRAGVWPQVEQKIVYAPGISVAKQYADTGNADAAFTALSLVAGQKGNYFTVSPELHRPIEQALCILKSTPHPNEARAFAAFIASPAGRAIFRPFGYALP